MKSPSTSPTYIAIFCNYPIKGLLLKLVETEKEACNFIFNRDHIDRDYLDYCEIKWDDLIEQNGTVYVK